jgi:S1-C subfamily serine protease
LPPRLAGSLGRQRALEVVQLVDGSPAGAGGVRAGDLILDVDGQPIEGVADLQRRLGADAIGRQIDVRIARGDRLLDLAVTPGELTA